MILPTRTGCGMPNLGSGAVEGDAVMNLMDGASKETFVESHVVHCNSDGDKETGYGLP